jgi:hypothetical protein
MVGSQIGILTLDPSFGHNLCFKFPNGSCEPILKIYILRTFSWYKKIFNLMNFDPSNFEGAISGTFKWAPTWGA